MAKIEEKRKWRKLTESNLDECAFCDNVLLAARTGIVIEKEDKGKACFFGVDICDDCRRKVCTCDACSAFNREPVDLTTDEGEEDEVEESVEEETEFECFCQKTPEMDETDEDDWCLQWTQARVLPVKRVEWLLDGRPDEVEEEEG